MQTAQTWAVRSLHESQLRPENCFLTLTYDPNYLLKIKSELPTGLTIAPERLLKAPNIARVNPVDNSQDDGVILTPTQSQLDRSASCLTPRGGGEAGLSLEDHQLFMKRVRDKVGPLRFFMCGEYGKKLTHPHYHYLLFGYNFPDRRYHKTSESGEKLYRSATLEKLWPFGHAWIGEVTYESCAYVASYIAKKYTGEKAWEHYRRTDEAGNDYWLMPEFALMSRRPGIASDWIKTYHDDVYTQDLVIVDNVKRKPPRYYDKLLAEFEPARWEELKFLREKRAQELAGDNTPARLEVKEHHLKAKMEHLKKRNLENRNENDPGWNLRPQGSMLHQLGADTGNRCSGQTVHRSGEQTK